MHSVSDFFNLRYWWTWDFRFSFSHLLKVKVHMNTNATLISFTLSHELTISNRQEMVSSVENKWKKEKSAHPRLSEGYETIPDLKIIIKQSNK